MKQAVSQTQQDVQQTKHEAEEAQKTSLAAQQAARQAQEELQRTRQEMETHAARIAELEKSSPPPGHMTIANFARSKGMPNLELNILKFWGANVTAECRLPRDHADQGARDRQTLEACQFLSDRVDRGDVRGAGADDSIKIPDRPLTTSIAWCTMYAETEKVCLETRRSRCRTRSMARFTSLRIV